jgi:type I restriction enzyme M protein
MRRKRISWFPIIVTVLVGLYLKSAVIGTPRPVQQTPPVESNNNKTGTLLRLPTGLFYSGGVKANVLFFDGKPAQEKPWTKKLWVYDLHTNMHFTEKTNPLKRADLDEFVEVYKPSAVSKRNETWSEKNPEGRWRVYENDDLIKREKVSLDVLWLKDKSLEDSDDLPPPDELTQEIADDLQTAWEQFALIAEKVKG